VALGLAPAADAASPARPSNGLRLTVKAGGPYRVAIGSTVKLSGTFVVTGQEKTMSDLTSIGRALRAYNAATGSFPPAFLVDANGTPTLSWRVLLLPYLDHADLYARFDLTKSWNDPANKPLLSLMPDVYRAAASSRRSTTTDYVGVSGSANVFQRGAPRVGGGVSLAEVQDGDAMTIAVGPVGRSVRIAWSAPGDIDTTAQPALGTADGFDGPGAGVTPLLFLDGQVRPMRDAIDPGVIESWSTIAGGGCAPPDSLALQLAPAWDTADNGSFRAFGSTATFTGSSRGRKRVAFRVVDASGTATVAHATVIVQ
jgi:Protein of unknown function (DUF1559)